MDIEKRFAEIKNLYKNSDGMNTKDFLSNFVKWAK